MEGVDLTKAMLNKGKQMANVAASAANGNAGKKRRKGTDLKPIVTKDGNPAPGAPSTESYVLMLFDGRFFGTDLIPLNEQDWRHSTLKP